DAARGVDLRGAARRQPDAHRVRRPGAHVHAAGDDEPRRPRGARRRARAPAPRGRAAARRRHGGRALHPQLGLLPARGLRRRRPRVAPARTGLLVAATVAAVTLATALAYAQVALAWAPRYLALLAGPFVVLASIGLAQMGGLGVAAAIVAAAFSVGAPPTST